MITITLTGVSMSDIRRLMTEFLNQGPQPGGHFTATGIANTALSMLGEDSQPLPRDPEESFEIKKHHQEPTSTEVSPVAEEPKKRTRRTKAEIEADKLAKTGGKDVFANGSAEVQPAATAAPSQVSAPAGYSRENVHQALQQVNVAVGLPKSREILQSFNANRISEIKEDQFKAFVDKCNEVVMLQG